MPHACAPNPGAGPHPGRRRRAREFALQALFQSDAGREPLEESLRSFWETQGLPDAEVRSFTEDLVRGVERHREEIDGLIRSASEHWGPERLAAVDRTLLRLAVYELLHRPDIPPKVTINEYIEIAKKFSTEDSGAFVNGLLDRISREHGVLPGREP